MNDKHANSLTVT